MTSPTCLRCPPSSAATSRRRPWSRTGPIEMPSSSSWSTDSGRSLPPPDRSTRTPCAQAGRTFDRARNIAAQLINPFLIDAGTPWRDRLSEIAAPTLILHGTDDPLFPYPHAVALAAEIPSARLIPMERTGHETFPPNSWDTVVPAILDHTAQTDS